MAVVGYRRLSGAIGLSPQEKGTRGMWWEKRRALLAALRVRGNDVHLAGRVTKLTGAGEVGYPVDQEDVRYDVLVVEFWGTNPRFFAKDLAETYRKIELHRGPVVYLCDDPDLWFPWKALPREDWSRWFVLANAASPDLPVPSRARIVDFPVASLLPLGAPVAVRGERLVYLGRPAGREAAVRALVAARAPLRVYGRPEEWQEFGVRVFEPPPQPERGAFYAGQLGALALSDAKHKKMLWRTGRAYHAIAAGCPMVAEAGHKLLAGMGSYYENPRALHSIVDSWKDPGVRKHVVQVQQGYVVSDRALAELSLHRVGL